MSAVELKESSKINSATSQAPVSKERCICDEMNGSSSPEKDARDILGTMTPLSAEFDPLTWSMEDNNNKDNKLTNNSTSKSDQAISSPSNHAKAAALIDLTSNSISVDQDGLEKMPRQCTCNETVNKKSAKPDVSPYECTCQSAQTQTHSQSYSNSESPEFHLNSNSESFSWPSNIKRQKTDSDNDYDQNNAQTDDETWPIGEKENEYANSQECNTPYAANNECSRNTNANDNLTCTANSNLNATLTATNIDSSLNLCAANTSPIEVATFESANYLANKIVNECIDSLHDGMLVDMMMHHEHDETPMMIPQASVRHHTNLSESVQSESSSLSSKEDTPKRKKIIIKKSSPNGKQQDIKQITDVSASGVSNVNVNVNVKTRSEAKESGTTVTPKALVPHEQQIVTTTKKSSLEVNLKPASAFDETKLAENQKINPANNENNNKTEMIVSNAISNATSNDTSKMNGTAINGHADSPQTISKSGRQKKYEMIIRENTPQELPPDVVRSNSKVEEPLDNLHLDLRNIRSRFESGTSEISQISPTSNSSGVEKIQDKLTNGWESISARMQRYQSAACGEKVDESSDGSDRSDGEEADGDQHDGARRKSRTITREKIQFEGMSSLKSQWEQGVVANSDNKEDQEQENQEKKEELMKLREKISLGRSESMKQTYERACKERNNNEKNRSESIIIESPSVKTESIKEMFEKGNIELDIEREEAEKIERLRKEREEELSLFNESVTASKEARNIFKEIDANASRGPFSPPPNASHTRPSFKHATSFDKISPRVSRHSSQSDSSGEAISEVVKCGDPITPKDDIVIDANQLQERFSYFENYKETAKEQKRFQITPPRDVTKDQVDGNKTNEDVVDKYRDPNIVRCDVSVKEDVPKSDTAKKMLDKFKALENQGEIQPTGPKPIKRITPPKEYTKHNDPDHHEPSPVRDSNIVRSSYKTEENIPVEPEMTRSLKEKFEKWSVEIENKKNYEGDEEEYVPFMGTTKNLKAKFEALKEHNPQLVDNEKSKPRVNRFVHEIGTDLCLVCGKRIYTMEKMELSGVKLHKNCFRCSHCSSSLRLDNYSNSCGKLYCTPHYKQMFMTKGNYDEGFGREQHKDKWGHKSVNVSDNNNMEETHIMNQAHDERQDVSDNNNIEETHIMNQAQDECQDKRSSQSFNANQNDDIFDYQE